MQTQNGGGGGSCTPFGGGEAKMQTANCGMGIGPGDQGTRSLDSTGVTRGWMERQCNRATSDGSPRSAVMESPKSVLGAVLAGATLSQGRRSKEINVE